MRFRRLERQLDRGVDTENAFATDPKMRAPLLAKIPMGRAAQPEEIAALVAFLASPACAFSTGANFDIIGKRGNITPSRAGIVAPPTAPDGAI